MGKKKDPTDDVMAVASVIFKRIPYKQFIRPWNRMLRAWGASAFHATDFYNGAGEFERKTPRLEELQKEHSKLIPKIIGENIQRILIVSYKPQEFEQIASPQWKAKFGTSVHSQAVQLVLISNGWWRHQKCPSESFAYFMESGDTDEGEVVSTVERMRHDHQTGTAQVLKVASFATLDKGVARGLEAADFVAWQWNKYYMDKIRAGLELHPRKDFAALVAAASSEKVEYIFATGAYLKYIFSLVPPEFLDGK